MGRAVSEDCQPASATLLHSVNPLPLITRFARLRKYGLETFVFFPRQILQTPRFCLRTKSLRSLCKISSSKSQKTPAGLCPSVPTGEERSPSLTQCGVDPHPSWPERFQLRWQLRLRLGNVSKLPFLSACTKINIIPSIFCYSNQIA